MEKVAVIFKKLNDNAMVPEYDTYGAPGCDISIPISQEVILYPGEVKSFSTGFAIKIPDGYEAQIRSRSGMTRKGIVVANAPATLGSDHTGEVMLLLLNITSKPVHISPNQKVAQMVFAPVVQSEFVLED